MPSLRRRKKNNKQLILARKKVRKTWHNSVYECIRQSIRRFLHNRNGTLPLKKYPAVASSSAPLGWSYDMGRKLSDLLSRTAIAGYLACTVAMPTFSSSLPTVICLVVTTLLASHRNCPDSIGTLPFEPATAQKTFYVYIVPVDSKTMNANQVIPKVAGRWSINRHKH